MSKFLRLALNLFLLSVFLEGFLRIIGFYPHPGIQTRGTKPFVRKDSVIGWILSPGEHKYSFIDKTTKSISINSLGARSEEEPPVDWYAHSPVIFLGDSFTMGTGLSENETVARKLSSYLSERPVLNFGVIGYSTCQSYLLLKRLIEKYNLIDPTVIYGFNHHHEMRNIAYPGIFWRTAYASPSGKAPVPYCVIQDRKLIKHSIEEYRASLRFLVENSSVFTLGMDIYYSFVGLLRIRNKEALTLDLVEAANNETKMINGQFLIYIQEGDRDGFADYYIDQLSLRGISAYDLTTWPGEEGKRLIDGHPGPGTTDYWARSLQSFLDPLSPES